MVYLMSNEQEGYAQLADILLPEGELTARLETLGGKQIKFRRIYMSDFALISKAAKGDMNKISYMLVARVLLEPKILPDQAGRLRPDVLAEMSKIIFDASGLSSGSQEEIKNLLEPISES